MSSLPEPHNHNKNRIEVELDLSNYTTKSDWKNETGADTPDFPKKSNLASLKSHVDKLDILKTTLVHLCNLTDLVKNKVDKKTQCGELVRKVNVADITNTSKLSKKRELN